MLMKWIDSFITSLEKYSDRLSLRINPEMNTRYHYMVLTCVITGLLTGLFTWGLDVLIHFISVNVTKHLNPQGGNAAFVWLPTVGIALTILFVEYYVRRPLNHGCDRLKIFLREKKFAMPPRLMWSSTVATSLTLGFGGSAGGEGPSSYTGAAVGSNVGRFFRLTKEQLGLLVGIGAGAGIAGIFRSPIGGVLFSLEVLRMPMGTLPVIALIVACLTSGITAYLLAGSHFDVTFNDTMCPSLGTLPWIILLGLVCGVYSSYYAYTYRRTGRMLNMIGNRWARAVGSGLMIGIAIYIFPSLYATGYDSLDMLLAGKKTVMLQYSLYYGARPWPWLLVAIACGIALVKPFACSATNYGGGVAGNFAPTLFGGGFLGFAFVVSVNILAGAGLNEPAFLYLGMAGAMAGIIEAPLMAIFLTAEMADKAEFLWPLAIVSVTSWTTRKLLTPQVSIHRA